MKALPTLVLPFLALACADPEPALQSASAPKLALGERLSHRCLACHALEPGRNTPAAPTLHQVVNRAVAAEAGYNYSPALLAFAVGNPHWTPELLDRFLTDPAALVPGTEMGFPGLADAAERRAVIAWLMQ